MSHRLDPNEIPNKTPSFEDALRSLAPAAVSRSEVDLIYACGFRAGLAESAQSTIVPQSLLTKHSLRQWMLAACVSGLIVGPASYFLGRQRLADSVQAVVLADARSLSLSGTADSLLPPDPRLSSSPSSSKSDMPGMTDMPGGINGTKPDKYMAAVETPLPNEPTWQPVLSSQLFTAFKGWLGSQEQELAASSSEPHYLTSRRFVPWNAGSDLPSVALPTMQPDLHVEASASHSVKSMTYIESLRTLSNKPDNDSVLPWLN